MGDNGYGAGTHRCSLKQAGRLTVSVATIRSNTAFTTLAMSRQLFGVAIQIACYRKNTMVEPLAQTLF